MRSDAMNCGPPGVCLGSLRHCENQKRTRFRFLPITCPSKSVFPKLPCPPLKICIPVRNADGGDTAHTCQKASNIGESLVPMF